MSTRIDVSHLKMIDFLSIDPGVNTGWAYWKRGVKVPAKTGIFRIDKDDKTPIEKLKTLAHNYRKLVDFFCPGAIIIEDCEYRGNSRKGQASAASGALALLSKIVGGYAMMPERPTILIPAIQWKGNLPGTVVDQRVHRETGIHYREHEREAVGIGLHVWERL